MVENRSELILNNDGSIYHLALKPGDVADTIITVGDPERVSKVSSFFDSVKLKKGKREFLTHTGEISGREVTVISTGIGTDNVDIVLNELHSLKVMSGEEQQPYSFIRLGTSGAVRPDVPMESVLISESAIGFDGLMHFYQREENDLLFDDLLRQDEAWGVLPKPYFAEVNSRLLQQFMPMADTTGITVTAPGFYAPQGRSVNAPAKVSNFIEVLGKSMLNGKRITNLEMETSGIYGLSLLMGHEAISISAILANRSTGEFSKNPETVVEDMIKKALEVIVS